MKIKTITLFCLAFFLYVNSSFSKNCGHLVVNINNNIYNINSFVTGWHTIDTSFADGNIIDLNISFYFTGACAAELDSLKHDGINIDGCTSSTCTISDTGTYVFYYFIYEPDGISQYAGLMVRVHRTDPLSVGDFNQTNKFRAVPSISSGLFYLQPSSQAIQKIQVTNCAGKVIYSSYENLNEINLSGFSDGIYFYIVEEKNTGKFYRGKIIKESL
jgi:hypothetical protein